MSENPADIAAEIIKRRAAEAGIELADDFDEQVTKIRAHYDELIPANDPLEGFSNKDSLRKYNQMTDDFCAKLWTTEYPTKPGYYWIRNYHLQADDPITSQQFQRLRETPQIVELYSFRHQDQELGVVFGGRARPLARNDFISFEWYGPIEPPE